MGTKRRSLFSREVSARFKEIEDLYPKPREIADMVEAELKQPTTRFGRYRFFRKFSVLSFMNFANIAGHDVDAIYIYPNISPALQILKRRRVIRWRASHKQWENIPETLRRQKGVD